MSHPVHQANDISPFGDLTRECFYKKHNILHHESFMHSNHGIKIFTQSWRPDSILHLRGLVAMIHGYSCESSGLLELTAVAIAQAGFFVCALDLQGHGYSQGLQGHIPDIGTAVHDCIQLFDVARADHPKLPAFLYGESLGGAIAMLVCLNQKGVWNGLILSGAMCGVSPKFRPVWALEKLLPLAAFFVPTWTAVAAKSPANKSYKEEWKRKLAGRSPNWRRRGRPTMATALEFLRVCEEIQRRCCELELPLLMVHGEEDSVCDCESARLVYKLAASEDKTLKTFPGMWHMWIGEPKEHVEMVLQSILSWMGDHAEKTKKNQFE